MDTALRPGTYVRTPDGYGTVAAPPTLQARYGAPEWIVRVHLDKPLMADPKTYSVDHITVSGRPATVSPEEA